CCHGDNAHEKWSCAIFRCVAWISVFARWAADRSAINGLLYRDFGCRRNYNQHRGQGDTTPARRHMGRQRRRGDDRATARKIQRGVASDLYGEGGVSTQMKVRKERLLPGRLIQSDCRV